ncbi:MAG: hypothetical protein GXY11_05130 [Clostridiales bacterium]|jgi:hypothetical protein|nr:hypothetical protein [Clostridiales bacterium]
MDKKNAAKKHGLIGVLVIVCFVFILLCLLFVILLESGHALYGGAFFVRCGEGEAWLCSMLA